MRWSSRWASVSEGQEGTTRCLLCHNDGLPLEAQSCPHCGACQTSLLAGLLPFRHALQSGHFIVEYPLGKGGFGVTYRAMDTQLEQVVAIKEFMPPYAHRSGTKQLTVSTSHLGTFERHRRDFLHEGRILARIRHPGVVRVSYLFEENNTVYLVMDYIQGVSLARHLEKGPLPEAQVFSLAQQICSALGAVHQADILHLDVKPDNLLLQGDGRVLLVDFGAARRMRGESRSMGAMTELYAPMEQMFHLEVSPATDLHALGVTLAECLDGRRPPSLGERMGTLDLGQVLRREVAPPRLRLGEVCPGVPAFWRPPLEHAMALFPEERPASAQALFDELASLRSRELGKGPALQGQVGRRPVEKPPVERPLVERPPVERPPVEKPPLPVFETAPVPATTPIVLPSRRTRPAWALPLLVGLSLGIVALVGLSLHLLTRSDPPRLTEPTPPVLDDPAPDTGRTTSDRPDAGPRTAAIRLYSNIPGAEVFLDGKQLSGQAPMKIVKVSPGDHRLQVRKAGYRPWSTEFVLGPGETLELRAVLEDAAAVALSETIKHLRTDASRAPSRDAGTLRAARDLAPAPSRTQPAAVLAVKKKATSSSRAEAVPARKPRAASGPVSGKGQLVIRSTQRVRVQIDGQDLGWVAPDSRLSVEAGWKNVRLVSASGETYETGVLVSSGASHDIRPAFHTTGTDLTKAQVQSVMASIEPRLKQCAARHGLTDPVVLTLQIQPSGYMYKATVSEGSPGAEAAQCLEHVAMNARFPSFKGESKVVRYTYIP